MRVFLSPILFYFLTALSLSVNAQKVEFFEVRGVNDDLPFDLALSANFDGVVEDVLVDTINTRLYVFTKRKKGLNSL